PLRVAGRSCFMVPSDGSGGYAASGRRPLLFYGPVGRFWRLRRFGSPAALVLWSRRTVLAATPLRVAGRSCFMVAPDGPARLRRFGSPAALVLWSRRTVLAATPLRVAGRS